uniref:Uncharacterized protein n=1 Tax=Setaria italica TaxID=4555 RepID=K3ZPL2_SETIT
MPSIPIEFWRTDPSQLLVHTHIFSSVSSLLSILYSSTLTKQMASHVPHCGL